MALVFVVAMQVSSLCLNGNNHVSKNCIALSHARRFGKSHAAGMIDAYYSLGCDSSNLFDDTEIAKSPDYRKYMNKYNVIHIDVSSVWDFHKEDLVESIQQRICEDLKKEYSDILNYDKDLFLLLQEIYDRTNIPFVIIIDFRWFINFSTSPIDFLENKCYIIPIHMNTCSYEHN